MAQMLSIGGERAHNAYMHFIIQIQVAFLFVCPDSFERALILLRLRRYINHLLTYLNFTYMYLCVFYSVNVCMEQLWHNQLRRNTCLQHEN